MLGLYVPAVRRPSRSAPLVLKMASGAQGKVDIVDIHMLEIHVETPVMEKEKKSAFLGDSTPRLF